MSGDAWVREVTPRTWAATPEQRELIALWVEYGRLRWFQKLITLPPPMRHKRQLRARACESHTPTCEEES